LELKYDEPHSSFAFDFTLHHYIEGMKAARDIAAAFNDTRHALTSPTLLALISEGADGDALDQGCAAAAGGAFMPELAEPLSFFERAFDWASVWTSEECLPCNPPLSRTSLVESRGILRHGEHYSPDPASFG
jgi:hypothetical protein